MRDVYIYMHDVDTIHMQNALPFGLEVLPCHLFFLPSMRDEEYYIACQYAMA